MVTLSVLAILLGIAAPSVRQFIINNRLTEQANGLLADLSRARSEAGARHTPVTVCAAENEVTCAAAGTTNWESGWIVFADADEDGVVAGAADIIRYRAPFDGQATLVSSKFSNAGYLTFRPHGGFPPSSFQSLDPDDPPIFKLCDPDTTIGRKIEFRGLVSRLAVVKDENLCP